MCPNWQLINTAMPDVLDLVLHFAYYCQLLWQLRQPAARSEICAFFCLYYTTDICTQVCLYVWIWAVPSETWGLALTFLIVLPVHQYQIIRLLRRLKKIKVNPPFKKPHGALKTVGRTHYSRIPFPSLLQGMSNVFLCIDDLYVILHHKII